MNRRDVLVLAVAGLTAAVLATWALWPTPSSLSSSRASSVAFIDVPATALPVLRALHADSARVVRANGKPLLLHLWATWCGPCRDELPSVLALDDPRVDVIALSVDQSWGLVAGFFDGDVPARVLRIDHDVVRELVNANVMPVTLLVDVDNRVVARAQGVQPWTSAAIDVVLQHTTRPSR